MSSQRSARFEIPPRRPGFGGGEMLAVRARRAADRRPRGGERLRHFGPIGAKAADHEESRDGDGAERESRVVARARSADGRRDRRSARNNRRWRGRTLARRRASRSAAGLAGLGTWQKLGRGWASPRSIACEAAPAKSRRRLRRRTGVDGQHRARHVASALAHEIGGGRGDVGGFGEALERTARDDALAVLLVEPLWSVRCR